MINTRFLLCMVFVAGTACGMERAQKRLKLDVMLLEHADAASGTLLFKLLEEKSDNFSEDTVRELVKRGVPLDKANGSGDTVLCRAIITENKEATRILYKCGASLDYPLARCILRSQHKRQQQGYYYPNKAERLCGRLWADQQRKKMLMAYLCSMRTINVLPSEMIFKVLSYYPEILSTHCLESFYDLVKIESIKHDRGQDARKLFRDY